MSSESFSLTTRSQDYDPPPKKKTDNFLTEKKSTSLSPSTNGIQIQKPILDAILQPPKSTLHKYVINPNTCDA